jgi:hypothetical protein
MPAAVGAGTHADASTQLTGPCYQPFGESCNWFSQQCADGALHRLIAMRRQAIGIYRAIAAGDCLKSSWSRKLALRHPSRISRAPSGRTGRLGLQAMAPEILNGRLWGETATHGSTEITRDKRRSGEPPLDTCCADKGIAACYVENESGASLRRPVQAVGRCTSRRHPAHRAG